MAWGGREKRKKPATDRLSQFVARVRCTRHNFVASCGKVLSPARYSMLSPKLPSGPRRSISSQECKEPKSYLGVDPSYTGDEEHNAMLCRCLKQKNKLRSRQQLLSSGPPCAEKLCSRKQETQTFGLLGARRESFDLSCKGLSNKPSGQHRRWHGIP